MTSKNVKIISFLTVILLTVMLSGAVFAAENTNSTASADNTVTADMVKNMETTQITDDTQEAVASDNTITKTSDKTALKSAPAGITLNGTDTADYATVKDNIESNPQYSNYATTLTLNLSSPTYTITEPITFNAKSTTTELIINGHGAVIDGSSTQSFLIIGEGATVTLNDFKVINTKGDYGGAIANHGTLTVNNMTFVGNNATYRGGAIFSDGALTVTNSNFTNNAMTTHQGAGSKDYGGGAIFASDKLTVDGCVFDSNLAAHNDVEPNGDGGVAGAILLLKNDDVITITNSNFTKNSGRHGGAITIETLSAADVLIQGNNFVENDALYGAAIDTYNTMTVTGNNFTKNKVDGQGSGDRVPMGGAINLNGNGYTATITNNNFTENTADENGVGGAVFSMPDTTLVSSGNTFEKNHADKEGGALYNQGEATSTGDKYAENTASTAGAVISFGTLTSNGNTYQENEATGTAGAILSFGTLTSDNDKFIENTASQTGAIQTQGTAIITNGEFTQNSANAVGTIFNTNQLTITDTKFTNNKETASQFGNLIYTTADVTLSGVTVDTNDLTDSIALRNGATVAASGITIVGSNIVETDLATYAMYNVADYQALLDLVASYKTTTPEFAGLIIANLTGTSYTETAPVVIDETFNGTLEIQGNAQTIDANSKQFLNISEGQTVIVKNITVKNAAADYGAAIYNKGTLTVTNSVFEDNKATYRGGAIHTDGALTVTNSNFTGNNVTTHQGAGGSDYGGGAIFSTNELIVDECVFDSNLAAHNDVEPGGDGGVAGAISLFHNDKNVTIKNSNFTKNSGRHGGAITIQTAAGTEVLIQGNNFEENDALYGAAIDTYNTVTITENNFTRNYVDGQGSTTSGQPRLPMGAAICVNNKNGYTATITNNNFTENEAKDGRAGAVHLDVHTNVASSGNTYKDNKAARGGVFFDNSANLVSENDVFINNVATEGDITFVNSSAANGKGVASVEDAQITTTNGVTKLVYAVDDSEFVANDVTINNLKITETDLQTALIFDVANYAELVKLVQDIKDAQFDLAIIANLTGTEYTETAELGSVLINDAFLPASFTIEGNGQTIDANGNQFMTIVIGKEVTVKNLTIKNGKATYGGAINSNGTLNIDTVTFKDNVVQKANTIVAGGAIYSEGKVTVNNSRFENNLVDNGQYGGYGGAIYVENALYIYNSVFDGNIADASLITQGNGAAIAVISTYDFIVDNTTFTNNKGGHGGAIFINDFAGVNQGNKKINNTVFTGNQAIFGGAIETYNDLVIENSTFEENSAFGFGSANGRPLGGAICVNNLVPAGTPGSIFVKNTTFTRNTVPKVKTEDTLIGIGSAIYNAGPHSNIENCTFTDEDSKFSNVIVTTTAITGTDNNIYANASTTVNDNNEIIDTLDKVVNVTDRTTGIATFKYGNAAVIVDGVAGVDSKTFTNTFELADLNGQNTLDVVVEYKDETGFATYYSGVEFTLYRNYTTLVPESQNVEAYALIENPVVITGKVINYDGNNVTSGKVYLLDTTGVIAHSDVIVNGIYSITLPTSITNTVASKTYTLSYVDDVNYKNSENITTITIKNIEGIIVADGNIPMAGYVNKQVSFTFIIKNSTDDNAGIIPVNGTLKLFSTSSSGLAVPVNSTATFVNGVGVVGFTPDVAKEWSLYAIFENATLDQAVGYNIASSSAITYESIVLPATIVVSPETVPKAELNTNATIIFTVVDGDNVITNLNKDKFTISVDTAILTDGYNITIKGGNVTLDVLMSNLGSHTVTIAYLDDVYTATKDVAINVTKTVNMTIVNGDALVAYPGEEVSIQINVTDGNVAITQGKVTIVIDNVETQTPLSAEVDTTGIATVTWTPTLTDLGGHTINVVYEDAIYEAEPIDDGYINVQQVSIDASVNPEEGYIGVPVNITAEFTTGDLTTIPVGYEVRFLSGETELGTALIDADGKATITSTFNAVGEYPVSVAFVQVLPDKYVLGTNTPANVTIHALPAEIILDQNSYVADLGENVQVDIRINPLMGNEIISEGYIIITDSEGNVVNDTQGNPIRVKVADGKIPTVTIKAEKVGTNEYTVSYESEGNYEAFNVTFTIEVEAIGTTVEFDTLPTNLTVGQTVEINVSVIAADNSIVDSGTVTFTDKYGQAIAQENVVEVENGKATLVYTASKVGSLKIFATYSGDNQTYAASEATAILKTGKAATTLTVDPVDAVIGKTVTLTARVENDNDYMDINEGKVVFKVNGKTIKDEAGKVIYVLVQDGVATLNYTVPESWNGKEITISAVYSGSTNYNSSRGETSDVIVLTGEASIEITSSPEFVKDAPKNFTAKVSDNGVPITEGRVVFKINGKTLKDPTTGKVIYTDVDANGVATLENFVVTSTYYKTSSWTLKAVFVSSAYDRVEATQDLEMVLQD